VKEIPLGMVNNLRKELSDSKSHQGEENNYEERPVVLALVT